MPELKPLPYNIFCKKIKSRRIELGLSLREASEGIMSVSYLNDMEQGHRKPANGEKIVALAKVLKIDVKELLEMSGLIDEVKGWIEYAGYTRPAEKPTNHDQEIHCKPNGGMFGYCEQCGINLSTTKFLYESRENHFCPKCYPEIKKAREALESSPAEKLVRLDAHKVKCFFANELHIDITTYAAEQLCDSFGSVPVEPFARKMLAENKRLGEALEKISKMPLKATRIKEFRQIARDALDESEGKS